ncbi:HD domain-containing protein [Candidatus Pacearchaeota archaeon]|nr:HD domain-containing protein [Candidatus Pacearchaeota archaeon]
MKLTTRFNEALVYAAQLHAKQTRKGSSIPYIAHLLAVAGIALENGADEDQAIAALLHDAVEDQGGEKTGQEIRKRFGNNVAEIVEACSDTDIMPKPPWQKRKEDYISHLKTAGKSILLVSASDKLHNARAILTDYRQMGEPLWSRFSGSKNGTLWYYRSLTEIFKESGLVSKALVQELDRVVSEIEHLASVGN